MKKTFATALAICVISASFAQDKIYYKNATAENGDFSITIDNAVSTKVETKCKVKITNKTADFLILKPEECIFTINGKEMKCSEKTLIIQPNSSDFRVMNLKAEDLNKVKDYNFTVGGIYKVSTSGTALNAPDFKLPPSTNDFKAGDFSCSMSSLSKETDKTSVKFKCAYNGAKVGFINPTKAAVKMPNDAERANEKTNASSVLTKGKSDILMLMKGDSENITLEWNRMQGGKSTDMQKVDMTILWRDCFTEAVPEKLKSETLELKYDEVKSK